ncbi:carbohydrate ABC transporter permease [Nocardia macrotermitis]|uniref:Lactose transport system permease protein LacF n=1 Tax=Nocardia macrotermitis TaxID=2585198 RepID=A0A7K0DA64_9NOCA|nr:sugar ABC transporter permease [Nocardia macrotermitis]MQY22222.1 Lactose transport system permease protein LacF [Nocardia macrotermitis]
MFLAQRSGAARFAKLDRKLSPYLYIAPFFVIFGVVGVFPLLYTVYVSLFHWELGADHPRFAGLGNYSALLGDDEFWTALLNTVSIFVLSSGPQIVVAVLLGALLDRVTRFPTVWRTAVLLPYAASLVAVGVIFTNLFGPTYGLINALLEIVGVHRIDWQANRFASHIAIATMVNWRWTGYNALIVLAAMKAIPRELYEAAIVDGAGAVRRFVSITLPLLRPTLIFIIVTSTIGGLQIFTEPKLFDAQPGSNNGGSKHQFQTISLYLYQSAFETQQLGYAAAIGCALMIVILLFAVVNFLLTRRLAAGGEK